MTSAEPYSVLSPDGTVAAEYVPSLPSEVLLEAFRLMLFSRAIDERAFSLQRQGRLGTFSTITGQEASVVGSAFALVRGRDWIVPQYRELPAMLHHGYPLERFFLYFMGDATGNAIPSGVKVLPYQIALAAQIPHAVGLAWGLRHQGDDGVVCVYFGEGASSEGDFHEACNLAGIRRAPVILFLQNNGWAISTPVGKQTAAATFASRAAGYGFAGELVDGNDLLAVHEITARAVERARAGEGPTLIESLTYRLGAHNTADDLTRYIDAKELEAHRALDPILRLRRYLAARGLLTDSLEEEWHHVFAEHLTAAVTAAEAAVSPGPSQIFDHVYAEPFQRLREQRAAAERTFGERP